MVNPTPTPDEVPSAYLADIKDALVSLKVALVKNKPQAYWYSKDGAPAVPLPKHEDPLPAAAVSRFMNNLDGVKRADFLSALRRVMSAGASATGRPSEQSGTASTETGS